MNKECITLIATDEPKRPRLILHEPFDGAGPKRYRGPFSDTPDLLLHIDVAALRVVLVDLRHLRCPAVSLLRGLRRQFRPAKIIVLMLPDDAMRWGEAREAGADGCMAGPLDEEELKLVTSFARSKPARPGTTASSPPAVPLPQPLTAREGELMKWVAEGASDKEIADALKLSILTVKRHLHNVYSKLGVVNRIQALNRISHLQHHSPA